MVSRSKCGYSLSKVLLFLMVQVVCRSSAVLHQKLRRNGDLPDIFGDRPLDLSCGNRNTEIKLKQVILPNRSTDAGASLIKVTNISSEDACFSLCCRTPSCTVAVFKEVMEVEIPDPYGLGSSDSLSDYAKSQVTKVRPCYLFNCGSERVCQFKSHPQYDYMEIVPVEKPPIRNLALYNRCRLGVDTCAGRSTTCLDGVCRCPVRTHAKNGVCRRDCDSNREFECTNGAPQYASPDCIARYDVCDGIAQCSDGSDEKGCLPLFTDDAEKEESIKTSEDHGARPDTEDHVARPGTVDMITPESTSVLRSTPAAGPVKGMHPAPGAAGPVKGMHPSPGAAGPLKGLHEADMDHNHYSELVPKEKSTGQPSSSLPPGIPNQGDSPSELSGKNEDKESFNKDSENPGKSVVDVPKGISKNELNVVEHGLGNPQSVVSTVSPWERPVTPTAWLAVALMIGLILTLVLALYGGCRYRKARPYKVKLGMSKEGEEDYLINGMYL